MQFLSPRIRGFTVATSLLIALVVCSAAAASSARSKGTTHAITITVDGWKGGGGQLGNITKIDQEFEKANPGIKVDWKYINTNTYQTVVNTQLLGGTAADVVMVDNVKAQLWSKAGYLANLGGQPWVHELKPALASFAKFNGKTVVFPQEIDGVGLYANLDLLHKVGVSTVPTTWPEFTAALAKLKAAGATPIDLGDKGGWSGEMAALTLGATDVSLARPNWDMKRAANKAQFSSAYGPVLNQITQLGNYINFQAALDTDPNTSLANFEAGNTGFIINGSWDVAALQSTAKFKFAFAPVPGAAAGHQSAALLYVGTGLAVNAHSKVQAAAKKYIDFWSHNKILEQYLKAESAITTLQKGSTPPVPQAAPFLSAVNAGRGVVYQPQIWRNNNIEAVMQSSIEGLMLGSSTPASVLQQWDAQFPGH